jgi:hypothetical protein
MSAGKQDLPRPKAETIILDEDNDIVLAVIDAFLWPPAGAIVELGNPNRDAVVRQVRLRLSHDHASVRVYVYDQGERIPLLSEGGDV